MGNENQNNHIPSSEPVKTEELNAARKAFRTSVRFQINFVLHSGLEIEKAIDHVCAAVDRLVAHEWQPIETAPKDGSMVLGWYKGWNNPIVIWWYTGAGRWNTAMQPTHWMPLPIAPNTQETSDDSGITTVR